MIYVAQSRLTHLLIVQTRTVLAVHVCDVGVIGRIGPNDIETIIRIHRRIIVPERLDNIGQSIMFPAKKDVSVHDVYRSIVQSSAYQQIRMLPGP